MLVLLTFAFVSGVITILSPCILPVLPIVLSGSVGGGRARPFGVLAGFMASFTVFTLTLSAIVRALGIPADALRILAAMLIAFFGVVMVVPKLRDGFELLASRIASRGAGAFGVPAGEAAAGKAGAALAGFWSGIAVGVGLGLVWTPCVGPIMASVISLALTQRATGGSVLITLAYTFGTSIPMLAVMLGGRTLLARVPALARSSAKVQRGLGVVMVVVAVAVGLGWDMRFQAAVLKAFPSYGAGLTAVEDRPAVRAALKAFEPGSSRRGRSGPRPADAPGERLFTGVAEPSRNGVLRDYGLAPEFLATTGPWFNTRPLSMQSLRGKVVLVDFWTYSCVNCVRTLPYLRAWYDAYRSRGLVIVGVHTPEFEFEKKSANVERAIRGLGVTWPVVMDNDYMEWNAYGNHYWPAHYFVDATGHVRYVHFGEGEYDASEKVIQSLLAEAGASVGGTVSRPAQENEAGTPETYLGYERGGGLASATEPVPDRPSDYLPARTPRNGEWTLEGRWTIARQYVVPEESGTLQLGFQARNVFLVIEPGEPGGTIAVRVDGKPAAGTPDVKNGVLSPGESRMYQVVGSGRAGSHVLRLDVRGKLRLFAFTFG